MKLNKRIKSSLVQTLFFNIALLVGLLLFILLYVFPGYKDISSKKEILEQSHSELKMVNQQGISAEDFKEIAVKSSFNEFTKEIIKNITDGFYVRNFTNSSDADFEEFISKKEQEVVEEKKASLLENRSETISRLLPVYVTNASEEGITDFEFINYVESLLYSFNLVSRDSIGVGDVKKVDTPDAGKTDNLAANMFYIPLSLELTGQKGDILDFIHFLENVGSIDLQDGEVRAYTDSELSKRIPGQPQADQYNIYENQFSEIEMISMDSYIDASLEPVTGTFTDFIDKTQRRQRFSMDIDLRFYVQGLPDYKIENYINTVSQLHSELLKQSQKGVKLAFDSTDNTAGIIRARSSLRSASNVLSLMQDDIKNLKIDFAKSSEDVSGLFNTAVLYEQRLLKIQTVLEESLGQLTTNK